MELTELILALSITVVLPLAILKSVMDYKKAKLRAPREGGATEGLTLGELKQVLREVVQEANAPLAERIESLERAREAVPDPEEAGLSEPEAPQERTLGRRVSG